MQEEIQSMTLSEYQKYINNIIKRLYREKRVDIVTKRDDYNKKVFDIELNKPEWFNELSIDMQTICFNYLQRIVIDYLKNGVTNYNKEIYGVNASE